MHKLTACVAAALAAATSASAAPVQLTKVGSLAVSWGSQVAASRDAVYLVQGNGIQVVDVTNPAAPVIVATVPGSAADLAVVGRTLYALTGFEIVAFDITNPLAPARIGGVAVAGAKRFVATPGFVYVIATATGQPPNVAPPSLRVVSFADPTAPVEIGAVALAAEPERLAVSGSYAYVAAREGGLRVVDVAEPSSPREIAALALGDVHGVAASGGYVYATEHGYYCESAEDYCGPVPGRLHVIDVSMPECPREIAVLGRPQAPQNVVLDGRQLYITEASVWMETYKVRLSVIDVTNPAVPVDVAYYSTPQGREVAVSNGYVYAPAWFEMNVLRSWSGAPPVCPVP